MANYSRWDEIKKQRPAVDAEARTGIEQDLALGQLIYDLRTEASLTQRELAERMGTTQSVICRLEEGGGARNRIDTLARVATALDRHLIVSFPEKVPPTSRMPFRSRDLASPKVASRSRDRSRATGPGRRWPVGFSRATTERPQIAQ